MDITSRNNPLVTSAAALKERKFREKSGTFLIEGKKLFAEAVSSGIEIVRVFCTEKNEKYVRSLSSGECLTVSDSVIEKISTEKSPEGIICVAGFCRELHCFEKTYSDGDYAGGKIIILDGMRDPGNVGTVIRTAAAMGIDRIIMSPDCADIYNPKTVRGSMGMLFRQKIDVAANTAEAVRFLSSNGKKVYAAMLDSTAERLDCMNIDADTVFIVGNEGHGISDEVASAAERKVYIPMAEGVESLNASVAAALFMYEMRRV